LRTHTQTDRQKTDRQTYTHALHWKDNNYSKLFATDELEEDNNLRYVTGNL